MLKFGTDGVRGVANAELTPELALALGRAAARELDGAVAVIGRDPRRSGALLEAALAAGLASEGVDVVLLGVVPTPAVAHAAAAVGGIGAVISASHNPFPDNGIKLFAGGDKLPDDVQVAIETTMRELDVADGPTRPTGAAVGTVAPDDDRLVEAWTASLVAGLDGRRLDGLSVVLDCAHGAASAHAPQVLRDLGVGVTVVHAEPDGVNINEDAGSTSPAALQAAVVDAGADCGLALDGDADRLLAVDATGRLIDGDQLIAILAIDRRSRGALPHDAVVVTVMSNLGFRQGMARHGIDVVATAVGDRYVLEALAERGVVLGGEQSGHIIQTDRSTTGDGLLTAVTVLDLLARSGRPLGDLVDDAMTVLPQVLVNVRLDERDPDLLDRIADDVAAAEQRLGDAGRVLIRPSGTEPLIRVMVEAPTEAAARTEADTLADAVRRVASR